MRILLVLLLSLNFLVLKAQDFTIGTLPDVQNLTINDAIATSSYYPELQYYIDNKSALNLTFVASLGDNTTYGYGGYQSPVADFQRAKNGLNMLKTAGIPNSPCVGNHDMDYVPCTNIQELALTRFNSFFPVSEYTTAPYFGGYFRNMSNSYWLFSASGMDYIIVVVQTHDPDAYYDQTSITWANGILDQYANRRAIFITHDFYSNNGLIADVVKKHDNLFLAICGHTCARELNYTVTSPSGKTVNVIVTDYQCDADKGATIRYYTFKPSQNKICAYTYNITTKTFETDGLSQFCMDYQMTTPTVPVITNSIAIPSAPKSTNSVNVSATITDDGSISSAVLYWGLSSGSLTNQITMSAIGSTYSATIPAQADGSTVYYKISATDNQSNITTNTVANYLVSDATVNWFANYDGIDLSFTGWGTASFAKITNPVKGGINLSNNVGQLTKGSGVTDGIYSATLSSKIDFSSMTSLKIKVYSPIIGTFLLKLEDAANGATYKEVQVTNSTINSWEELTFNFTGAASNTYNRITLIFDYNKTTPNTFYFDDIELTSNTTTGINYIENNDLKVFPNPAETILQIQGVSILGIGVYNLDGSEVENLGVNSLSYSLDISSFAKGIYILKVKTPKGIEIKKFIKD